VRFDEHVPVETSTEPAAVRGAKLVLFCVKSTDTETAAAQIAPHLYCGPVVGAANIQLATCSPNFLILEGIQRWDGFHAELLQTPIRWEDGYVIPSDEPGLGVSLDEAVAERHPYDGGDLHLVPRYIPSS